MPAPFAVLAGPILGGLYIIFLPLVALGVGVYLLAKVTARGGGMVLSATADTVLPKWFPGRAHLLHPRAGREKLNGDRRREIERGT